MSVQEYLDKYLVSRKIEDAVNAAVRAKAPDPVLFIVILLLSSSNYNQTNIIVISAQG